MASSSILAKVRGIVRPEATDKALSNAQEQSYLYGLRGLLTLSSVLWIFFQTFIPALVSDKTHGPLYQKVLRIVFSPIFWNESLISGFFFALSGRSICIHFLQDPKPDTFAGSIIRRIIRMSLAVGLASGIVSGILKAVGVSHIDTFKIVLPNNSITTPKFPDDALTAWNSMFDMFWVVRSYYYQAANHFWPTATIWNLSLIYQQSWTVYFLEIILPFTRATWHFAALLLFAAGSFWMCSWGWYDATALLLADYSITPKLRMRLDEGLTLSGDWRVPFAVPAAVMILVGFAMKFVWAVFPQYIDKELVLHPFLDLSENTTRAEFAAADPYPRLDNYLVIFGVLLLVETTVQLRNVLSARWLVGLGKRSLSKSPLPNHLARICKLIRRL
jgi:hypothetical protein